MVVDTQAGAVKYHNSILAEALGNEEKCRYNILLAYKELLKSPEFEQIISSYRQLNEWSIKAKLAADEIVLLGYIPGQCHVCKCLGM
jgi:hypothetical protein